ncbi:hypothetical protein [Comamonas sp.]|uniref:hypothetical protein n=1 Tax=Comamonas sp. TaxID=34028 RepID=UPI0025C19BD4|nr:hypothetical protein [Comamonas sp.]
MTQNNEKQGDCSQAAQRRPGSAFAARSGGISQDGRLGQDTQLMKFRERSKVFFKAGKASHSLLQASCCIEGIRVSTRPREARG